MRDEHTMYELILETARKDEHILAVYMNGSRTNPNVPKDLFQDYDIVYVVDDVKRYREDRTWFQVFGEILYMQFPDDSPFYPPESEEQYGWLMQFADGNRMDLTVQSAARAKEQIHEDKLCRILLDKQGILPKIPEATDEDHWVKKPSKEEYLAVCNEFWWCTNNLAKGLWRKEIPYVQDMSNFVVRKQLERMLGYKAGSLHDFKIGIGKSGKYLYRFLSKEEWEQYLATYFGSSVEEAWDSIMKMCDLFEETARYVGSELGYTYNQKEGQNARAYLEHVRGLGTQVKEVY